jgi:RNA polymerase sigma-70 factor (ECF subfamily)
VNSETFPFVGRIPIRPVVNLSDDELARRALQGDLPAFNRLVEGRTPALYAIIRRMCSDRAEAEAITQEAFLRAWEHLQQWKPDQPFWPWLVKIALNAARDALKKNRPLDFADLPNDPAETVIADDPDPETLLERSDLLVQLTAAVECLPIPYRVAITMRYQAEMSYEEMAVALNLPINTVRTHLRRAKRQLRTLLETDNA